MKRNKVFLSLIFIIGFLFASIHVNAQKEELDENHLKIIRAIQYISLGYIEEVDEEELVEDAIRGMLKELDPHSVYLSKEDIQKANEPLIGSFEGIGIQFNIIRDTIVVISPIPGGPSEKVGIMPGDRIVKIDGENSTGGLINNTYVQNKLRGEKGSKVNVGIVRHGVSDILDFTITRDKIPINSLDAAFIAAPDIGYIKLNRFSRTTMQEYRKAFNELQNKGMKHLILDLNYNSGGYLDVAIDLTNEFFERDKMITYVKGHATPRQEFKSRATGNFKEGKLVVLINEGSASASEILSGAVQDWDRGLLVGRRTFGKGLVQRPFELPDGSVIRLTTAMYYTPSGRSIQKPYEEGIESYYNELANRLESGELISPEKLTFPDSLKYETANNRIVYGGGGIMPDFFIPIDTNRISDFHAKLHRSGVLNSFGFDYANNNRQELLEKYPEVELYIDKFEVDEEIINELVTYADRHDVPKDPEEYENGDEHIIHLKNQIKALIARNIWDFGAYTQIIMQENESFNRALQIIQDDTFSKLNINY